MKKWTFIFLTLVMSQMAFAQSHIYTSLNGSKDLSLGMNSLGCSHELHQNSPDFDTIHSPKCQKIYIFILSLKKTISTLVIDELADRDAAIQNAQFYYDIVSRPDQENFTIKLLVRFEEYAEKFDLVDQRGRTNEFALPTLPDNAYALAQYISTTELQVEDEIHLLFLHRAEILPVVDVIADHIQVIVEDM